MLEMYLPVLMAIVACGTTGCDNNTTVVTPPPIATVKSVYNQAYQENYAEDSIADIITNAQNAYVLVDPFLDGVVEHIATIQSHGNEVGGYISAGTGENWRDDFSALQPYLTSIEWPEWPGEFYVSHTTTGIVPLMEARIDKMAAWGLDWVEYDNMDWLDADSKAIFNLDATEQ